MSSKDKSKKQLFKPTKISDIVKEIAQGLDKKQNEIDEVVRLTPPNVAFAVAQRNAPRLDDVLESGWTFLISENDSMANDIKEIIKPLAKLRGMKDDDTPLYFTNVPENHWLNWINTTYAQKRCCGKDFPPRYVFIIGSPDLIPFKFQSMLSLKAFVGRLDFSHQANREKKISELKSYVDKLIRLDNNNPVEDKAIFASTDEWIGDDGCYDPTHYCKLYMQQPLIKDLRDMQKEIIDISSTQANTNQATKQKIIDTIKENKPALVYITSKSIVDPESTFDKQNLFSGSILCEDDPARPDDSIISSESLPENEQFIEGGVFFQFSDCSYGVPATSYVSEYIAADQYGVPTPFAEKDFVSSIPKRLLFNPKGPVAFIGRVDLEMVYSFTDAENPMPANYRDSRLGPFSDCVKSIMSGLPVGYSLFSMYSDYAVLNKTLAKLNQDYKQQSNQDDVFLNKLLEVFMRCNSAGNYMIFGDPAAKTSNSGIN